MNVLSATDIVIYLQEKLVAMSSDHTELLQHYCCTKNTELSEKKYFTWSWPAFCKGNTTLVTTCPHYRLTPRAFRLLQRVRITGTCFITMVVVGVVEHTHTHGFRFQNRTMVVASAAVMKPLLNQASAAGLMIPSAAAPKTHAGNKEVARSHLQGKQASIATKSGKQVEEPSRITPSLTRESRGVPQRSAAVVCWESVVMEWLTCSDGAVGREMSSDCETGVSYDRGG